MLRLNEIRTQKGLNDLDLNVPNFTETKEDLINLLTDNFEQHVDISTILKT